MDGVTVPGKLKLKGGISKKKKKSEKTSMSKTTVTTYIDLGPDGVKAMRAEQKKNAVDIAEMTQTTSSSKTKAQLSFERAQLNRQSDRVFEKAKVSHRERVEDFNKRLEELSEFNDIPKISWTK